MAIDKLAPDAFNDKPYYVYLYRDPRSQVTGDPIYVGKGTVVPGRKFFRADYHWLYGYQTNKFFRAVLNKIKRAGLEPYVEIVEWFTHECDALDFEVSLIKEIGRRDLGLGSLLNLTDGGDGITGYVPPPDVIEKHRRSGIKLWEDATPELREAMSKNRDQWKDPEIHAERCANMKAARAIRWADLAVREAHIGKQTITKLSNRDRASAKAKLYRETAPPEQIAKHVKNAGDARRRQAEDGTISKVSKEMWDRPGQREKQGKAIGVGQKNSWDDPVKGALRRERLKATYDKKRAEKEAKALAEANAILKMDEAA